MEAPGSPVIISTPRLESLAEFEAALAQYHVSPKAQLILDKTTLVLLIGPTSSGRNTIIERLMRSGDYQYIVSDTTRPKRINNGVREKNGVEYWFRSEDEMLADIQGGKFLEAEIIHRQQVSGTSIRELQYAHEKGRIAITDVDIGGVYNIVKTKPDTIVILILPPSFESWQKRLKGRGHMSPEEYRRRTETALKIFSAPAKHDFFKIVVNDKLEEAVQQVDALAHGKKFENDQYEANKQLAHDLYVATEALYETL